MTSPNGWTEWALIDPTSCIVAADVASAVAEEFQRLPLSSSALSVQPPSGWTLVNADTVAYTNNRPQTHSTTILGLSVAIRATPSTFIWDFGDGSPLSTTSDPGRPWPNQTVAHQYRAEGTHSISLTTNWSATFQIAGSPEWLPVEGTVTTTSTSAPLTVYEAQARLVAGSSG